MLGIINLNWLLIFGSKVVCRFLKFFNGMLLKYFFLIDFLDCFIDEEFSIYRKIIMVVFFGIVLVVFLILRYWCVEVYYCIG